MATMGLPHRKMSDWISPMTATVTPVHRGETSSRARFPKASSAHHCQALSSCQVELVNSTDLTPISWRFGVKNVNTAIFTTLHLCEFSRDHQKKYQPVPPPLEVHDPKVWGSYDQHRAREPAGSDSGFPSREFSKIQKFGEVGDLRIALSPRTRVRWAK